MSESKSHPAIVRPSGAVSGEPQLYVNPHATQIRTLHLGSLVRGFVEVVPFTAPKCPAGKLVAIRCSPHRASQWLRMKVLAPLKAKDHKIPDEAILDLDSVENEAREKTAGYRRTLGR